MKLAIYTNRLCGSAKRVERVYIDGKRQALADVADIIDHYEGDGWMRFVETMERSYRVKTLIIDYIKYSLEV